MIISIRSLALSIVTLGIVLFVAGPSSALAQTAPCGGYWGNTYPSCGTGTLLVYMQVIGQSNGSYAPSNFTVQVNGQNATPSSFAGSQSGTIVSLTGGSSYSVSVVPSAGYTATYSVGCNGTAVTNQQSTCVITMSGTSNYYQNPQPYPYPYSYNVLTCNPSYQTVAAGQTATFSAIGGGSGPYNWMTANRSFLGVGPVLNTVLLNSGTQTVTVTSGSQLATCTVNVTASGGPVSYTSPTDYWNNYANSPSLQYTYMPRLPNTGFAPLGSDSMAFAVVALIASGIIFYPYVRRAFASVIS